MTTIEEVMADKITISWYRIRAHIRRLLKLEYDFTRTPFVRCEVCGDQILSWMDEYYHPTKLCEGCRLKIETQMARRIGYQGKYPWRLARIFVRNPIRTPSDIQLELKRETQTNSFTAYPTFGTRGLNIPEKLKKAIVDYAFRKQEENKED